MMKRYPDPPATPTIEELKSAIEKMSPQAQARWGKMNGGQMLRHCSLFIELYLGRIKVAFPIRILARLIGPIFLRKVLAKSPTETPKNLSTIPAIRMNDAADLEDEKTKLLSVLDEVSQLSGHYQHQLYGKMHAEDVIALVRHHTAHHANQFGLL